MFVCLLSINISSILKRKRVQKFAYWKVQCQRKKLALNLLNPCEKTKNMISLRIQMFPAMNLRLRMTSESGAEDFFEERFK
mmetsp:Transcript_34091/g.42091  ORF Transcript_34091/g.42091 Transcript_34091/m.42091 type:complete len:81 (+) Transcript_34091:511-753(+)